MQVSKENVSSYTSLSKRPLKGMKQTNKKTQETRRKIQDRNEVKAILMVKGDPRMKVGTATRSHQSNLQRVREH